MNKTLVITAIALFPVVMGFGVMAPAIADHGGGIPDCGSASEIFDPNTGTCIPDGTCPNGVSTDPSEHCALSPGPPADPGPPEETPGQGVPPADPGPPEGTPGNPPQNPGPPENPGQP